MDHEEKAKEESGGTDKLGNALWPAPSRIAQWPRYASQVHNQSKFKQESKARKRLGATTSSRFRGY